MCATPHGEVYPDWAHNPARAAVLGGRADGEEDLGVGDTGERFALD